MRCFYTGKLSESGNRNGSVTPVWGRRLLAWVRFYRANMMTVADARQFVASRGTRRSGIAAPLWHIWLPAAPLRQLASSYDHACKSIPTLHGMHAWWIPDRVLGKWAFFMIFRLEAVPEQYVRRYFLQVKKHTFKRIPGSHTRLPTQYTRMYTCTGLYSNSSPLFLFWPKTNTKILYLPNLAQNLAKFAILKCLRLWSISRYFWYFLTLHYGAPWGNSY